MTDPALIDLHEVLELGVARGGDLLTAGEHVVVGRILALRGPEASLYARLSTRVPHAFLLESLTVPQVDDVGAAAEVLRQADLADGLVSWPERARLLPRAELAVALERLGLPRSGRKADLVARLEPHRGWREGSWLRLRHRRLLRRLERFAFLKAWPDRSTLVVARLGVVRWPEYTRTPGGGLFRNRTALRAWEALLGGPLDVEDALRALGEGAGRAPAGLDLERWLRRSLREHARDLERSAPQEAAELYRRLVEEGGERPGRVAFRRARAEEAAGRPEESLAVLAAARTEASDDERLAIHRAGRRLARTLRRSWAPERPLRPVTRRSIRLLQAPPGPSRPHWHTPGGGAPVEDAVCSWLAGLGRTALHGEGRPWSTLFSLLFAPTFFLPVPGALPVRFLSGPLDLGTPGFRTARAGPVQEILDAVARGDAPELVARAWESWHGVRLAGARWDGAGRDTLVQLAAGMGARGLTVVLEALLEHGRRAAAGLPDLAILPGEPIRLPGALPARLPTELVLAEVKGPGDTLRDAQLVWIDRLAGANVRVEVWEVSTPPS